MLRALCPLFLATVVVCQDAAERCAQALLRGDAEAAAQAATSAVDPAERARLLAALSPPSRRPAAMLAVAARFADSAQADLAILAGAAAVLALRDRGRAVPELQTWYGMEDADDDHDLQVPAPVIEGLWRQFDQRRAAGGDLAVLAEAEQLLQRCSVSRFGFEPVRVSPEATWSLPERHEELLLRAWRRQPGRSGWHELAGRGPADRELSLPSDDRTPIAALPAGDWLVELASTTTRWRGLRAVEVSDLDVVALFDGTRIAFGAWRGTQLVVGGDWWLGRDGVGRERGKALQRGAFAAATAVFGSGVAVTGEELFVQAEGQRARVPLRPVRQPAPSEDRWQVHLMVDRPIYRPGETVHGRLVLRETDYEGIGVDAVAHSKIAAHHDLELCVLSGTDEVRLRGRTDAHGVWAFEVPLPELLAPGAVPFALFEAGHELRLYHDHPCEIAEFRRAALLIDVVGAPRVTRGEDAIAAVRAAWASGAPAAGLRVSAEVQAWTANARLPAEQHELATDARGLATLELPLRAAAATWVRVTFAVATPEGPKTLTHTIGVSDPADVDEGRLWWRRDRSPRLYAPEFAVVGEPCAITVRGAAGSRVLFVAGRGRGARAESVLLDADGQAVVTVSPTRDEWPTLDLAVAGAHSWDHERVSMLLRAPVAPQITLPERVRPGAAVECRVATGSAGTLVTVAVVDERIFAIAAERTPEPGAALRPVVAEPRWQHAASAAAMAGAQLLGSMLRDGRVPASELDGRLDGNPAGAGGPASPGAGAGELRTDFRATAAFVTVVADADGVAKLSFTLPDDLTTWRVSLVGVAPDGAAFFERRRLLTRLPFAAEPVLPRVLRAGDAVQVPIAVDRQAGGDGDDRLGAAQLSATCDGQAMAIEGGEHQLAVAAGSAATALVTLRGLAAGHANLQLNASLGELQDGSRRLLQVQADALLRPVSAATMGVGQIVLPAPAAADPDEGLQVSVLGGSSAAWKAIEGRLTTYPYGCVEQTLSKLLPFFAAVRGAHVHGTPPPAADEPFQQRLKAGFARLRQLQHGRGGAFSFWPGGAVDPGMTALVMHGLAVVQGGGIDPARFGLDCDPRREPFAAAIVGLRSRAGAAREPSQRLEVELAAGCLRLQPADEGARAAVAAAVDAAQVLPAGLLARCGLALAAAGDVARAQLCLRRSEAFVDLGGAASDFPGENALAVRGLQLELQCVLSPRSTAAEACADVLLGCLNGYSTTYAQASVLTALALALPPSDAAPFTARLQVGDEDREVSLSADNGFTARLRVPFAARCAVTGPVGRQMVLRVVGQRREVGSTHAAWQAPVVVERALCRRRADATREQVQRHEDLVPIDGGALRVGEVVWLRLRVSSPLPLRYVVVECPLPAGFQFGDDLPWLERFDDRFALSLDWLGVEPRQIEVPLVPTLAGTMTWPPTTAAPMYANGRDGGTAGSVLTVLVAPPDPARPSRLSCLPRLPVAAAPVTVVESTPRQRAQDALETLDEAFDGDDPAALTAAMAAATEANDELRGPGGEPDFVLEELTDRVTSWRDDLRDDLGDGEGSEQMRAARAVALFALAEQQHGCLLQLLEAFERRHDREYDHYNVDMLVAALVVWPERLTREELLGKVLQLAMARGELPLHVLDDVEGPVEDERLRAVLQAMLATFPSTHGARILELLPREDLAAIAPSSLIELATEPWPDGVVRQLLASSSGRVTLRRALTDSDFVLAQSEALAAELPDAYWRELPLSVFAELYDYDLDGVDLAELLPRSNVSTAALQQALVSATDTGWQSRLALALHQRGVRDLGSETVTDDPYCDAWRGALALASDDAAGALQLLDRIAAELVWPADELLAFLRDILVRCGSVAQLARIAGDLDEGQCVRLFARLDADAAIALLELVAAPLDGLPTARTAAVCAALWAYAERLGQHDAVTAALCRSDVGLRFAEQQPSLRQQLRWHLGLDEDTGLPPVDEPWLPLLRAVAQRGVPLTWTTAERQRYDHVRCLRGVR